MTARRVAASVVVAALMLIAALTVVGCGGSARADETTPGHRPPAPSIVDADALNGVLAADQRAAAAYVAGGPLLNGNAQNADGWFLGQELTHAGMLRTLVAALGGVPHSPAFAYRFGDPRTADQVLALLRSVDAAQADTDAAAIARIDRGWLRARIAALAADDAQQLAVLRIDSGLPASTTAFPTPYRAAVSPSDDATVREMLTAQVFAVKVDELALRSGHLRARAAAIVEALERQERIHVAALARLLGTRAPESAGAPEPATILRGESAQSADAMLHTQGGWIRLLEALQSREEGYLYYDALPRLRAVDAPLATSLLAGQADLSVVLGELDKSGDYAIAAPAPLVRGWRIGPRPPW